MPHQRYIADRPPQVAIDQPTHSRSMIDRPTTTVPITNNPQSSRRVLELNPIDHLALKPQNLRRDDRSHRLYLFESWKTRFDTASPGVRSSHYTVRNTGRARTLRWLFVELHRFWIAFLLPVVALSYAMGFAKSEAAIRLSGLCLLLLGILTGVWGIVSSWKFLELGDPFARITSWVRRCPLRRLSPITGVGIATERADSVAARGYTWWEPKPGAPIEERISILERNIPLLN